MAPDFTQDFFTLLAQPRNYRLDIAQLDTAYHELQSQVHPDHYAHLPDAERRLSMQWSTQVNEAYRTLKHPLHRARYLLQLAGVDVEQESNTAMPAAFLMEQMEWREAVAEARAASDHHELEKLMQRLQQQAASIRAEIEHEIDETQNYLAAAEALRRLMFIEKLEQEIDEALEAIES